MATIIKTFPWLEEYSEKKFIARLEYQSTSDYYSFYFGVGTPEAPEDPIGFSQDSMTALLQCLKQMSHRCEVPADEAGEILENIKKDK